MALEHRLKITEEQGSKEREACPEGADVSKTIDAYFYQYKKLFFLSYSVHKITAISLGYSTY
jgi:hypothetical protein